MNNKYEIIKEKEEENKILLDEILNIENECNKYLILQENIDNYFQTKLPIIKYNITKLEDFLIEIAIIKCIITDDDVITLNEFNEKLSTKVDLIGLFNQIRGIRVATKYGTNKDSLESLVKFNNYLNEQKISFDNLKELIENKIIKLDNQRYKNFIKLQKELNKILSFSNILIEDIHLNILIEKDFDLLELKEEIYKLNLNYIKLLSNSDNKYDIDLYNKTYEKDLNKKKSKKI